MKDRALYRIGTLGGSRRVFEKDLPCEDDGYRATHLTR